MSQDIFETFSTHFTNIFYLLLQDVKQIRGAVPRRMRWLRFLNRRLRHLNRRFPFLRGAANFGLVLIILGTARGTLTQVSIEADETSSAHFTKQPRFLDRLLRHLNRRFLFLRGASNQDCFGLLCMPVRKLGMTLDGAF